MGGVLVPFGEVPVTFLGSFSPIFWIPITFFGVPGSISEGPGPIFGCFSPISGAPSFLPGPTRARPPRAPCPDWLTQAPPPRVASLCLANRSRVRRGAGRAARADWPYPAGGRGLPARGAECDTWGGPGGTLGVLGGHQKPPPPPVSPPVGDALGAGGASPLWWGQIASRGATPSAPPGPSRFPSPPSQDSRCSPPPPTRIWAWGGVPHPLVDPLRTPKIPPRTPHLCSVSPPPPPPPPPEGAGWSQSASRCLPVSSR